MKLKKLIRIFIVLLLISNHSFAFEKVGTTSFQFLKVMTTARAAAMAGAYSSIAIGSDAVFWNPAALTSINNFDATFGYVDWFLDITHYSFSAAFTVEGIGTFALQGLLTDVGELQETEVGALGFVNGVYNPGLTGKTFSPQAMVMGISYARALNDKFSFGVTAKYAHEDLIFESAGALIFDGGIEYKTGFRSIVIAATLRNFGPEIKFVDEGYPLPQTLNIGVSSYIVSPDDHLFTDAGNHSLLVSYDIIQPRDFDQQHSVGLEYSFNDMLFLRGGYLLNGDQEGVSLGTGFQFQNYHLDYAFNEYGEFLESVHRVSLRFGIN